jgi:hypothetical protein
MLLKKNAMKRVLFLGVYLIILIKYPENRWLIASTTVIPENFIYPSDNKRAIGMTLEVSDRPLIPELE